ncbi:MAG: conserved hypothetical secreted protein [Mycobacterium sp.]|jgi:hypothetical protein|nr:conserved hypothetical secreted protein [Mycobacterium sp.]
MAAAAILAPLLFVGALYTTGAAHASCVEGSSYTSPDSGIMYLCIGGEPEEGGYLPGTDVFVQADGHVVIPGNGVFRVGVAAAGTYRSAGSASSGGTCSWATHRTLGAGSSDIVDRNASTGQLYAQIPSTVAAFETNGCQPWQKVS